MVALNATSLCRNTFVSPGWTSGSMYVLVAGRRALEGQMIRSSETENVFQLSNAEMNATAQQPMATAATRVSSGVFATSLACTAVSRAPARFPTAFATASSVCVRTPRRRISMYVTRPWRKSGYCSSMRRAIARARLRLKKKMRNSTTPSASEESNVPITATRAARLSPLPSPAHATNRSV